MLRWDDIARSWMRMPMWRIYILMAKTFWRYVGSGAFNALQKIRRLSTWVGMYPVLFLTLYLVACDFRISFWNRADNSIFQV